MATATTEDRAADDWLYVGETMRMLGLPRSAIRRLIEAQELTTRSIPGCRVMISRRDVEALARRSTRPARPEALAVVGGRA